MLSHPWYLALQMVLRAVDLCLLSARLLLAASVLGVSISASQSVIYAAVHFALGALSPTGDTPVMPVTAITQRPP